LREQKGFTDSSQSRELLEVYRKDNNNVISFVDECCVQDPMESCEKGKLYKTYKDFCEENGYSPLGMRKFGKRLKKYCKGVSDASGTGNVKTWQGIKAK